MKRKLMEGETEMESEMNGEGEARHHYLQTRESNNEEKGSRGNE